MQTFSNHDSLLNAFEMDDIDPIDIFEDRAKSASILVEMPTKPSHFFSTPDTQEDELAQLRRESATEKKSLDLGITSSSINTSMIETVKSENEMLVSTPRIEDLCSGLGPVSRTSKGGNKKTKAQKNKEPEAEIQSSTHSTDDTSLDQKSDEMVEPVLNFFVPTSTDNGSEAKLERKEIILNSTNSTVSKRNSLSGGSRSSNETMEERSLTAVENLQCFTENGTEAKDGLVPIHKACAHFAADAAFITRMIQADPSCPNIPTKVSRNSKYRKRRSIDLIPSQKEEKIDFLVDDGQYALHIALCNNPSLEVIQVLLQASLGTLSIPDHHGMIPLSLALCHYNKTTRRKDMQAIIELILRSNPKAARVADIKFNLPLHHACMISSEVMKLPAATYSPKKVTRRSSTDSITASSNLISGLLELGVSSSDEFLENVIRKLIQHNPDAIHAVNFNGNTPLDIAQNRSGVVTDKIVNLLQEYAFEDGHIDDGDLLDV
ncbi:hypothetical protein CTEN210_13221 [Chaetoceros tenuissimus]|uniref:Uncharacterized protein n=1 Tax=Chaetoceros tenuissimus TaxID=426638 RepID=A0AAD3D4U2_9STRA|nr:hypothetical protein CTEN210_13221 [Chaetoceros tenuissimus]